MIVGKALNNFLDECQRLFEEKRSVHTLKRVLFNQNRLWLISDNRIKKKIVLGPSYEIPRQMNSIEN